MNDEIIKDYNSIIAFRLIYSISMFQNTGDKHSLWGYEFIPRSLKYLTRHQLNKYILYYIDGSITVAPKLTISNHVVRVVEENQF